MRWLGIAGALVCFVATASGSLAEDSRAVQIPRANDAVVPRLFYTRPGQFEIIVLTAADALPALEVGTAVWSALAGVWALPADGFSTPVSVYLVPGDQWSLAEDFTVTGEAPSLVSVRVRWKGTESKETLRQAMVRGLLLRQAVAWHGTGTRLSVPDWLIQGGVGLSRIRARPALLDAFQQDVQGMVSPPSLAALLKGELRGDELNLAALGLVLQLLDEADGGESWRRWVSGVVAGADAWNTLPRVYSGLWSNAADLELWWQCGLQYQARNRSLPVMTAADARAWLADRSRWLVGRQGREVLLELAELPQLSREPWIRAELTQRIRQAHLVLPTIHPYYTNATLSLGRLYDAALKGNKSAVKKALDQFERDARDARELENSIGAILDTAPRK